MAELAFSEARFSARRFRGMPGRFLIEGNIAEKGQKTVLGFIISWNNPELQLSYRIGRKQDSAVWELLSSFSAYSVLFHQSLLN